MPASQSNSSPRVQATARRRTGERVSPLYQQVYAQLRAWLLYARPDADVPLPSEHNLAQQHGVSRITIRRTLAQLAEEGLITRIRGRGTFPVTAAAPSNRHDISGYLDTLLSLETSTTAQNLSLAETDTPPHLVEVFGDTHCLKVVRLRRHLGVPISYTTLHVPAPLAAHLDPVVDSGEPIIHRLEQAGVIAERTEQTITALSASQDVAGHLGVAPGVPLICMRRLMRAADRSPVLHQESLYAPDKFEYRMILTRTRNGPIARWTPIA
jgi:GntR family transcriptional regulator